MNITTNGNAYINAYHTGKKGYLNKFEKSLKLPFLSVLNNNLPGVKNSEINESKIDGSETALSDNVELSSAVVNASNISDSY